MVQNNSLSSMLVLLFAAEESSLEAWAWAWACLGLDLICCSEEGTLVAVMLLCIGVDGRPPTTTFTVLSYEAFSGNADGALMGGDNFDEDDDFLIVLRRSECKRDLEGFLSRLLLRTGIIAASTFAAFASLVVPTLDLGLFLDCEVC